MKKLLMGMLSILFFSSVWAQDAPQVTKKYFIKNGYVTTAPGTMMKKTSILINDGIIEQIGENITAPYDAEIIDADSMYVYPAFVAALSHTGITAAEEEERPRVPRPGYPPNDVAGITPEQSVQDLFKKNDAGDLRKTGFAVIHTAPKGRMMPGKGSIITTNDGEYPEVSVADDVSLFAQFRGAPRMYPATTIGVMAKWRELYKNAELDLKYQKAYDMNPVSKKRPQIEDASEALFAVVQKEIPVFFVTNEHLDIHRAYQLQQDLGFKLIPSEIEQGYLSVDILKKMNTPALISLDLPKEDKSKEEDLDEDQKALLERKKMAYQKTLETAAMYEKAGIPMAFSYLGVKSGDILANISKLIENGLSEKAALDALTTAPAKVLGIDKVTGTIDPGKMANIIITTDTLFKEKTQIKTVLVEGKVHEIDIKKKKKSEGSGEAMDIAGMWKYEIEIPGMSPTGTMNITKDGESYAITVTSDQNPGEEIEATDIEVDGSSVTFTFVVNTQGMSVSIDNDLQFSEDSIEGSVSVANFGSFPITGSKTSSPE